MMMMMMVAVGFFCPWLFSECGPGSKQRHRRASFWADVDGRYCIVHVLATQWTTSGSGRSSGSSSSTSSSTSSRRQLLLKADKVAKTNDNHKSALAFALFSPLLLLLLLLLLNCAVPDWPLPLISWRLMDGFQQVIIIIISTREQF